MFYLFQVSVYAYNNFKANVRKTTNFKKLNNLFYFIKDETSETTVSNVYGLFSYLHDSLQL